MYLQANGADAAIHPVAHELYRVEKYTNTLNQIKDRNLRPQLARHAASAFVRNALFDLGAKNDSNNDKLGDDWTDETEQAIKVDEDKQEDDPVQEKPAKRLRTE